MSNNTDDTTESNEKKPVSFRVLDSRLSEWDKAVEDSSQYTSRTHLIVHAVEQELSDDAGSTEARVNTDEIVTAVSRELSGDIQTVKKTTETISTQLRDVAEAVDDFDTDSVTVDLQQAVLDTLPTTPDDTSRHDGPQSWGETVAGVHGQLDSRGIQTDESTVRDTLDSLHNQFGFVRRQDGNDFDANSRDTVYWRR